MINYKCLYYIDFWARNDDKTKINTERSKTSNKD